MVVQADDPLPDRSDYCDPALGELCASIRAETGELTITIFCSMDWCQGLRPWRVPQLIRLRPRHSTEERAYQDGQVVNMGILKE